MEIRILNKADDYWDKTIELAEIVLGLRDLIWDVEYVSGGVYERFE